MIGERWTEWLRDMEEAGVMFQIAEDARAHREIAEQYAIGGDPESALLHLARAAHCEAAIDRIRSRG